MIRKYRKSDFSIDYWPPISKDIIETFAVYNTKTLEEIAVALDQELKRRRNFDHD